ncbi:hypothetical protein [Lysobacter sp. A421]
MLTKEQANAAADVLLQDMQSRQEANAAKRADRRQSLADRKWIAVGGLLGLTAGGIIGSYFFGQTFPSTFVGLVIGALLGKMRDGRDA